jgi:hypothetical protein
VENEDKTELDQALEVIPDDLHTDVLKLAHKYRVDETDPTWILLRLAVEAQDAKVWAGGAAKAAGEAADRVRESMQALPSSISSAVSVSASEVKTVIDDAGVEAGKEVKKAGFDVGKAILDAIIIEKGKLVGAIKQESDNFKGNVNKDAVKIKSEVIKDIEHDVKSIGGRIVKTEWTKTLVFSVLVIVLSIFGAFGGGWVARGTKDSSCTDGATQHIWTNGTDVSCVTAMKGVKNVGQ